MKKQILAGILSATMVVGMGGVSVFAADKADDKTYNIGICQLVQHEALDAATQGFKDAITEELGDKVTFDEQNAQGDSNTCSTIITDFVSKNVDSLETSFKSFITPISLDLSSTVRMEIKPFGSVNGNSRIT